MQRWWSLILCSNTATAVWCACSGINDRERAWWGTVVSRSHCYDTIDMTSLQLPRGSYAGLVQFGSFSHGPHGGKLVLLVAVGGSLGVAVREVPGAHPPVRAPLVLRHVKGG